MLKLAILIFVWETLTNMEKLIEWFLIELSKPNLAEWLMVVFTFALVVVGGYAIRSASLIGRRQNEISKGVVKPYLILVNGSLQSSIEDSVVVGNERIIKFIFKNQGSGIAFNIRKEIDDVSFGDLAVGQIFDEKFGVQKDLDSFDIFIFFENEFGDVYRIEYFFQKENGRWENQKQKMKRV